MKEDCVKYRHRMVKIANTKTYISGMQKSIADKLWFMKEIDPEIKWIYDFGCADGSLLAAIHEIDPTLSLIGYDMSPEMIQIANSCNSSGNFFSHPLHSLPKHTLLNASSVFHEIHSYGTPESVRSDYDSIFGVGAEYIAIRDMFFSESMPLMTNPYQLQSVKANSDHRRIKEFERIHGSITINKNFLHYLLKYRYVENWEREVRENYLPNSIEKFIRDIPSVYCVERLHVYTLPFLRQKIREDFGFWFDYPTHAQILLKRK